jgi:hypothetical protein
MTAWNTRSAATADAQKEREAIIVLIKETKGEWRTMNSSQQNWLTC